MIKSAGIQDAPSTENLRSLQRLASGTIPPPPVAPTTPVPDEHPGFRSAEADVSAVRRTATRHPAPATKAAEADKAAKPPADAKESQAKTAKAAEMEAAPVPVFDKAEFVASVSAAVSSAAPKTLDDADKFASSGASDALAAEVKGGVDRGKQASTAPLTAATAKQPDTSKVADKPVTPVPQENPPQAPDVDLSTAMPAQAPAEQTDLSGAPAETDARMAEADVTEEQLATSNEPEFTDALAAKKDAEQHSNTAPGAVRDFEAQQLATGRQDAAAAGAQGVQEMIATQAGGQAAVRTTQSAAQQLDEQQRAEVSGRVQSIFDTTQSDVDVILGGLDSLVDKAFSDGERDAKSAFAADVAARMAKYKADRYSGVTGWARWAADQFLSLPDEVNQLYAESKKLYEARMTTVISSIADLIGRELGRAKDRIAQGRQQINEYLSTLDPGLRSVGQEAAGQIGSQFEALTDSITDKGKSLTDDVAQKYVAARQAVDTEISAMQEQNKGLWDKVKDKIGGAVETITKLKNLLAGVLSRAAGAVAKIIKDPIGFLGNFTTAVKTGVMNFGSHISEHLEQGLESWLFGRLAEAGIEIPEKLDLKGIVSLVLSTLGMTWSSIRARLATVLPEWVLKELEASVDVVRILSTEGIGGLWTYVVDKVGDLEDQVLGQVKDFVITKIITAGISWLVSIFNPAAAFIKACQLIYDGVMWFVENADRLKDFADTVLDSVEEIAAGGAGKVADLIEGALGKTVPMVISGLADLLGLSGVADEVKAIIQAVQKPVSGVVDSIINGVIRYGKTLLGKPKQPKPGSNAQPEHDTRTPQERTAALDTAMAEGQRTLQDDRLDLPAVDRILTSLRQRYQVRELKTVVESSDAAGTVVHIVGANSPEKAGPSVHKDAGGAAQATIRMPAKQRTLKPSGLDAANPPPGVAVLDQQARDGLADRWDQLAAATAAQATDEKTEREVAWMKRCARAARSGARPPDGRASEQEVTWLHEGIDAGTQVRHRVPPEVDPKGTETTIPDLQVGGSWSVETKRYIIRRPGGKAELIAELKRQYTIRLGSLPAHAQLQAIIVDVRGQYLKPAEIQDLHAEIYASVVQACYAEAKAAGKWWVRADSKDPGPDSVTILAGDVG